MWRIGAARISRIAVICRLVNPSSPRVETNRGELPQKIPASRTKTIENFFNILKPLIFIFRRKL
jgi:hypothetical protein